MSKATYALKLPLSIKKAAQRLAQEDGVSLNQSMDRFGSGGKGWSHGTRDFVKKRAGDKTGDRLMEILHNAPHVPPEPEDMG